MSFFITLQVKKYSINKFVIAVKYIIKKILLLIVILFSLSLSLFAVPENNSIFRLQSKNSKGEIVYAVVVNEGTDKKPSYVIRSLTAVDQSYKQENSLWLVKVSGSTFTLQNVGTGKYLYKDSRKGSSGAAKHRVYYLTVNNSAIDFSEDDINGGYYYYESGCSEELYIHYDPYHNEWRYYSLTPIPGHDPKQESQQKAEHDDDWENKGEDQIWNDTNFPPSGQETSVEISGSVVEEILGNNNSGSSSGGIDIEDITGTFFPSNPSTDDNTTDITGTLDEPSTPIIIGNDNTYPEGDFWKTSTIQLSVNSEDWTAVSFPIDVKCATEDLSEDVGYQYYDTQKRANGGEGWQTAYISSDMTFSKGIAYHFATESKTMTLEFIPTGSDKLTKVDQEYSKTLTSTTGSVTKNQNWYYIGNALFNYADLSHISKISRYNRDSHKWEEHDYNSDNLPPFDAFFVQYSGDYSMAINNAKSMNSAPMRKSAKSVVEKYYLTIKGEDNEDNTGIFFRKGAFAEGYVIGEDFLSFATIGGATTEIYTYEDDINFSFNERPLENTFVRVGLYIAKAGTYTISLDNISGNAETFVLYDNYEGEYVYLHLGEEYTFFSERGEFNDRFDVTITYAPGVPTTNVSLSANKLVVVNNEIQGLALDSELFIYDSTGRLVYTTNVYSESMLLPDLNSGIYIVRNVNGWGKFVVK